MTGDNKGNNDERLVDVISMRQEKGITDTCLRPLGLCELGGCCDICWYGPNSPLNNPDHPQNKK